MFLAPFARLAPFGSLLVSLPLLAACGGEAPAKTADDVKTRAVLEAGSYTFIESESVLAEVDDQPGGMLSVLDRLAAAGVNVYGHLFMGRWGERATFAFVVDDPAKARAALGQEY